MSSALLLLEPLPLRLDRRLFPLRSRRFVNVLPRSASKTEKTAHQTGSRSSRPHKFAVDTRAIRSETICGAYRGKAAVSSRDKWVKASRSQSRGEEGLTRRKRGFRDRDIYVASSFRRKESCKNRRTPLRSVTRVPSARDQCERDGLQSTRKSSSHALRRNIPAPSFLADVTNVT